MTRVTFGDTPSPFLSIATVQKHAKDHERDHPMAAKEVSENMYVDDVLTGVPVDESAVNLRDELCNLLSKGGFQLIKKSESANTCANHRARKNVRLIKSTGYFMEHKG